MNRAVLGLDVGGANLKAAHTNGAARSRPFALWKAPSGLADALRGLVAEMPAADALAVTMTGELCDCFESRRQGVLAILDAAEAAAAGNPVRVWTINGRFVDLAAARAAPLSVAAANWLAAATFAGRYAPNGPALFVDVGSTTTDIVPLRDGRPTPESYADPQRLRSGELVYAGVRRTPLCALLGVREVAAELFATTLDAYLVLGAIPEDPADRNTADGRPATRAAAHARIARMFCADLETSTEEERCRLAELVFADQARKTRNAVQRMYPRMGTPETVILAGEGTFLPRRAFHAWPWFHHCRKVDLISLFGEAVSRAACAYAVAVLAAEG